MAETNTESATAPEANAAAQPEKAKAGKPKEEPKAKGVKVEITKNLTYVQGRLLNAGEQLVVSEAEAQSLIEQRSAKAL